MKKILLFLLATTITACTPRHTVTGHIDGLTNDTLFISFCAIEDMPNLTNDSDNRITYDTIIATNGRIAYDIAIERPIQVVITPAQLMEFHRGKRYTTNTSNMRLFLDKGERVKLNSRIDSTVFDCLLSGTRLNEDLSRHYQDLLPLWAEGDRIQNAMSGKSRVEQEALYEQFQKVMNLRRTREMNYIRANPNNPLAGYCLRQIPTDSILAYYERMDDAVRNSIFRPLIDRAVSQAEKRRQIRISQALIVAGNSAPDFTLKTIDKTNFTLSSLRGKYVVLDFWGSWCGWCIKGFPEMTKLYAKYKKQLEIVGIACKDTETDWKTTVKKYGLEWTNVINPENIPANDDIAIKYGVESYPTKIIIDPQCRIIAVFSGERPEFYQKLTAILK